MTGTEAEKAAVATLRAIKRIEKSKRRARKNLEVEREREAQEIASGEIFKGFM